MLESEFIGPLGGLLPVRWSSQIKETPDDRFEVRRAGSRSWAFTRGGAFPSREWQITYDSTESESASTIMELAYGAWGDGPFHFVSAAAYLTNVLTPQQSLLWGAGGGGMSTTVGRAPRSMVGPERVTVFDRAPVIPGVPVTVSLDTVGAAVLTVTIFNIGGAVLGRGYANASGVGVQRVSWSGTVPVGSAWARLEVQGHAQAAHPQLTWTEHPQSWAVGAGASSVVVTSASRGYGMFDPGRAASWWGAELTLKEVG